MHVDTRVSVKSVQRAKSTLVDEAWYVQEYLQLSKESSHWGCKVECWVVGFALWKN